MVNPLLLEMKWRRPGENQFRCPLHYILISYSRNGYNKNYLMYDCDPGELLVVLVIRHCVHAKKAVIKIAHSVEEDKCEVNASVGCKDEGMSTAP